MKSASLSIDLQNGFANDKVHVKVNGVEVYRNNAVTTQRLLGIAGSTKMSIEDGTAEVEIEISSRGLSWGETVEIKGDLHLGVAVEGGGLSVFQSKTPFGYA